MTKRLFLTYSNRDREYALELRDRLVAIGLIVGEPSGFPPGERWVEAIRTEIDKADAIIAVIPESGRGTANNVFFEIGAAHTLGKPILAVVPERSDGRRELPSDLMGMLVLDAGGKTVDKVAHTLANSLEAA